VIESQKINGIVRDCSIEMIQQHPMALTQTRKQELMSDYQVHETDTGSPDLQVALLTERVTQLTTHLQANPKDHASRRGLLKMISRRRSLLTYINAKEPERYQALIKRLGIRR
jgi:small subunit ribosomal protein S15